MDQFHRRRNASQKGVIKWLLLFLAGVFFVCFVLTAIGAYEVYAGLNKVRSEVADVEVSDLSLQDGDLRGAVERIEQGFRQAKHGSDMLVFVKPVPLIGPNVRAAAKTFTAGTATCEALLEGLTIVEDVTRVFDGTNPDEIQSFYTLSEEDRKNILLTLKRQSDRLVTVQTKLRIARRNLESASSLSTFDVVTDVFSPVTTAIEEASRVVDVLVPVSQVLDEFAGVNEQKQWLVLFLNNTELRPGGGFMGVYGLATVDKGEITDLLVEDTYAIDAQLETLDAYSVSAPQPISQYLGVSKWYFRDTNWSGDFATSSQFSRDILRTQKQALGEPVPQIDGVIGFTTDVASNMLDLVGPVEVLGTTFDSENVIDLLRFEVDFGYLDRGLDRTDRKQIVSLLTMQVVSKLFELPISEWPGVLQVLQEGIETKQFALTSFNEQAQEVIRTNGWSGTLPDPGTDMLFVVDANMNALKTDPYVERSVTYTVTPEDGRLRARVDLDYVNTATYTTSTSRYRTYTRIYVPQGSEFVRVEGAYIDDAYRDPERTPAGADLSEENGFTVFGAFTSIEPGDSGRLTFEYYLPSSVTEMVKDRYYELAVPKQIGVTKRALTLHLDFDKRVLSATPREDVRDWGDSIYDLTTELVQDSVFTVEF